MSLILRFCRVCAYPTCFEGGIFGDFLIEFLSFLAHFCPDIFPGFEFFGALWASGRLKLLSHH